MIITKISEQLKNVNRANVFIDGKFSFSLTLDQIIDSKIKIGQQIDEKKLNALKKLSNYGKLKARTIEWLYIRPRSLKELKQYLQKKDISIEEANQITDELHKLGYQNDDNFAKWWIEQRKSKNKSNRFISSELRVKGIDLDIINKYLMITTEQDSQVIKNLIIKKKLKQKYPDQQKLIAYLMRQGFSYGLIKDSIKD